MNAVKLWVIFKSLFSIVSTICITYAACYFNKPVILWMLLLPMLGMSLTVSSSAKGDNIDEN